MVTVRQSGQGFEPMAERIALASGGEFFQGSEVERRQTQPIEITWRVRLAQVDLRKIIEQSLRLTEMRSTASHGHECLWPPRSQCREHLMTQVIARELPVLIGRILDPAQLVFRCIGFQLSARNIEHGS